MQREPKRRSTRPGMGRANDNRPTVSAVPAVGHPVEPAPRAAANEEGGAAGGRFPCSARATVRAETRWFTPPPEGAKSSGPVEPLVRERPSLDPKRATTMPALHRATAAPSRKRATTVPAPEPAETAPPPRSAESSRRPRASIREDHVGDSVPTSDAAHQLLRRTVPRVLRSPRELAAAPLDHREGFLLAHIDGKTSVQALIDISGMPDEDLLKLLQRLRRLAIITLG